MGPRGGWQPLAMKPVVEPNAVAAADADTRGRPAEETAPERGEPGPVPEPATRAGGGEADQVAGTTPKLKGRLKRERERSGGTPGSVKKAGEGPKGAYIFGGGSGEKAIGPTEAKAVRFQDLGGMDEAMTAIEEIIMFPMSHPELYDWLGVEPPRGILLHGPPGCGKTTLAHAIATEVGCTFFSLAATEVVSGMSGESEAKVRNLFAAAVAAAPAIIFIDEIDAITPKRETAQREMERRIVAQLLTCMDDLSNPPPDQGAGATNGDGDGNGGSAKRLSGPVMVIGATNRADSLDPALRRAGRFDREIMLGVPDEAARTRILKVLTAKLRLEGAFDFAAIARLTPGYVGADLAALAKEAAAVAIRSIMPIMRQRRLNLALSASTLEPAGGDAMEEDATAPPASAPVLSITGELSFTDAELTGFAIRMEHFREAVKRVQPSAIREGFATVPGVTWDDIGALADVRDELSFAISQPISNPERFAAMGLSISVGVLLYGPPGCGKTLVAKAVANDAHANFISIKGPELLNKYVGESERAVRSLFARARAAAPCVLFFDEMDALAPRRGGDTSGGQSAERVVNQLLTELDGLEPRQGLFVVAATNRPDMIDPAMLRPGRLDKLLYVPLPTAENRVGIIQTLTRRTPLAPDVDVRAVANSARCDGFSGADMAALVREACVQALREQGPPSSSSDEGTARAAPLVHAHHFELALQVVMPSVSKVDAKRYNKLRQTLRRSRNTIVKEEGGDAEGGDASGKGCEPLADAVEDSITGTTPVKNSGSAGKGSSGKKKRSEDARH